MKRHLVLALLTGVGNLAALPASAQDGSAAAAGERTNNPAETPGVTANPAGASASAIGDSTAPAAATADAVRASTAATGSNVADIIVTGSRVVTNGNNSPTPVTVVAAQQLLTLQPTTITEAVNLVPALQGSQNVTSSPGGGQRNGAAAYFNLRNLGDLCTLVLFDGQRLVPTINQNQADVDASIVPQLLIKRVDLVTGGVAAVYGSDAVSGVINFITDRDFNGIKLQSSSGISTYGDDHQYDFGIAAGKKILNDRGHIEFSYQYRQDPGILERSARPFFQNVIGGAGLGTAASPYFNVLNQRISNTTFGGLITNVAGNGTVRDLMFTPSGTLTPFVHGLVPVTGGGLAPYGTVTAANANVESGGSGGWYPTSSIKSSIEYHQAFGRFDYDLTDDIHFYTQGSYSNIHTFNNYQSPNFASLTISYANPFLQSVQAPYAALFAANPTRTFTFSRLLLNEPRADQRTEAYTSYTGLDGSLGAFKWTINYDRSQSTIRASNLANIDNGRLYAATDAVRGPNGQTVCRASLTNAAYAGCVPLNLFGQGTASQQALDYVFTRTDNYNRTRQDDVNGSITGSPFSTWAGPVNVAVSGEWRRLSWRVKSNADPSALADCAGIAYNCVQGRTPAFFYASMGPLATVSQNVAEGALETDVPLLRDKPFFKALDITGAVRFTHYNTSGNAVTWKVGGDWQVTDDLRFRVTRSRDIRAPNLYELYAPLYVNPTLTLNDPLTRQNNVVFTNIQTSNPNLKPEKANTLTAGLVYKPHFLPRFSMSVDYFNIKVDDVIYLFQPFSQQILQNCATSGGTQSYCSLIVRPLGATNTTAANNVATTYTTYLNIAALRTWGIDGEINYKLDVFHRPFTVRALASYQPKLDFDQGPAGVLSLGGAATGGGSRVASAPKLKLTGIFSYDITPNVTATVLERWRSSMKASGIDGLVFVEGRDPAIAYTTLNLAVSQDTRFGKAEYFLNVVNLFNKFPKFYNVGPVGTPGLGLGIPSGDDPIGRYFTIGARLKI